MRFLRLPATTAAVCLLAGYSLLCIAATVVAEEAIRHTTAKSEQPPRKVIVGTSMLNLYGRYPGLDERLTQLEKHIDQAAAQAEQQYPGRGLDLFVLPENAVTLGRASDARERGIPLEGEVLDRLGAKAKQYNTYLVLTLDRIDPESSDVFNSAVLVDRQGQPVGMYDKVYPVCAVGDQDLEGGIAPGTEFPVFDCDFGKVGMQICFDYNFEAGWNELARKGAEIVAVPTATPQTVRPAAYAMRGNYYVVTSTFRTNASIYNPIGMPHARTTDEPVLIQEIDLAYATLHWSSNLHEGRTLKERFGDDVGFVYYRSEDTGVFWSNNPDKPIGDMIRELDLYEMPQMVEYNRRLQDELRGGAPTPGGE